MTSHKLVDACVQQMADDNDMKLRCRIITDRIELDSFYLNPCLFLSFLFTILVLVCSHK